MGHKPVLKNNKQCLYLSDLFPGSFNFNQWLLESRAFHFRLEYGSRLPKEDIYSIWKQIHWQMTYWGLRRFILVHLQKTTLWLRSYIPHISFVCWLIISEHSFHRPLRTLAFWNLSMCHKKREKWLHSNMHEAQMRKIHNSMSPWREDRGRMRGLYWAIKVTMEKIAHLRRNHQFLKF